MDAVNYIDVVGMYQATEAMSVKVGVLNLFGEEPPVYSGAGPALGNGNTYPTTYDTSTTMYASVKYSF